MMVFVVAMIIVLLSFATGFFIGFVLAADGGRHDL